MIPGLEERIDWIRAIAAANDWRRRTFDRLKGPMRFLMIAGGGGRRGEQSRRGEGERKRNNSNRPIHRNSSEGAGQSVRRRDCIEFNRDPSQVNSSSGPSGLHFPAKIATV